MGVRFFEDGNALDSLRSSDFDALSAYGEVIDNSIQASAKNIHISFEAPISGKKRPIDVLAFADDGCGMDSQTLASCLKLGWSSRFNDRNGIGRFGVGMVLGAIHECKRIEVYSKQKGANKWLWTYIDLDEVEQGKLTEIPEPKHKSIPKKYQSLLSEEHGTLVLWSKYDRQKESADAIIRDAHHYIGRTFRHFIWQDVNIWIDGEVVKAHDPLFLNTEKTKFPNDPSGTGYSPIIIHWPIRDGSVRAKHGETSLITIRMSLLPEEFRTKQGAGGSLEAKERHIDELQQGVSILREGREVFFGQIPYWSSVKTGDSSQRTWSFEEVDRWWGCEISFGAELDSSFEVRNIKRGAKPEPLLLSSIKEQITPTRDSILEEVRRVWRQTRIDAEVAAQKEADGLNRHTAHGAAEKAAAKGVATRSKYDADVPVVEAIRNIEDDFLQHLEQTTQARIIELYRSQPYTIVDDVVGWKGFSFWEVNFQGGKILMQYNLQHVFFKELRSLEDQITETLDPSELKVLSQRITGLVDLLLISFAKAEAGFDKNQTVTVEEIVETLNSAWGQNLNSFVKAWISADYGKSDG